MPNRSDRSLSLRLLLIGITVLLVGLVWQPLRRLVMGALAPYLRDRLLPVKLGRAFLMKDEKSTA